LKSKSDAIKGSKILIVDDHRNIRVSLRLILEAEGAVVSEAPTLMDAKSKITIDPSNSEFNYDLVLLDIRLPDGNGLTLLEYLNNWRVASRVIVISGEGTSAEAYNATQMGAFDYIEKPFTPERVLVSAGRCREYNRIEKVNEALSKNKNGLEIVGQHAKIHDVLALISKVAPTTGRVLITGESGTGKELIAREIHKASQRSQKTIIKVNCAAIPKNLMESELFGHEKGAFTGALKTRIGVFERADGGTLFLDEIGELDLDVQAKLLRVLQNGEFTRVGGEKVITSDVRIICATNRDLKQMCHAGEFREDLFYRLNVITIQSPALRERASDIPELSKKFLNEFCDEHSLGRKEFSDRAIRQLSEYSWPGNVRELRNVIERTAIFSGDSIIDHVDDLNDNTTENRPEEEFLPSTANLDLNSITIQVRNLTWEKFQETAGRQYLTLILKKSEGNVSEAARTLDVERAYLHRLMKKLGINRP